MENDNITQERQRDILVTLPDFIIVFGISGLSAMMAEYIDMNNSDEKDSHVHSVVQLLSYLTPHLNDIYKF